jgi:hypothetical protein
MANQENTKLDTQQSAGASSSPAKEGSLPNDRSDTVRSFGRTSGRSDGAATATARTFIDQAKDVAGQAYDAVTDKAATKLDEQKTTLSGGLSTVADSVRQVGDNLGSAKTDSGLAESAAKYTQTAAKRIEDVAGYFETKNVREMARDLEGFARRNPAIFLGAAFGLGLLAARFLKSTAPTQFEKGNVAEFGETETNFTKGQARRPDTTPKTSSTPDSFSKPV